MKSNVAEKASLMRERDKMYYENEKSPEVQQTKRTESCFMIAAGVCIASVFIFKAGLSVSPWAGAVCVSSLSLFGFGLSWLIMK